MNFIVICVEQMLVGCFVSKITQNYKHISTKLVRRMDLSTELDPLTVGLDPGKGCI